ncbi:hypothetical protein BpHYR1_009012 [Brachionus plicatilis]|uniref:Uncharacterized protein n=1 Tax=Brachionus plicatilis TaxID=10195 RepID=A0A3M7QE71_BRAPC|nr:hypothetical protein BpHYR1_009012 [Brachionus plicatilis]
MSFKINKSLNEHFFNLPTVAKKYDSKKSICIVEVWKFTSVSLPSKSTLEELEEYPSKAALDCYI